MFDAGKAMSTAFRDDRWRDLKYYFYAVRMARGHVGMLMGPRMEHWNG